MELNPQILLNLATVLLAAGIAWGAARAGARYEAKRHDDLEVRVDAHSVELEAVRIHQAEVRGILQGSNGLLERVQSMANDHTMFRADLAKIRTDIAVILQILKSDGGHP